MKYFHIKSWEEYQHGKTREYPWIKLYGSLFRRYWFIEMSEEFRYWTICLLDYSRENNNRNPLNLETFFRIYHHNFSKKLSQTWFNLLVSSDFVASKKLAEDKQDDCSIREEENRKEKNKSKNIFIKPTIQEVNNYIIENKYNVNPEKWLSNYEANGWMVGKNKMKDWKASIRYWNTNNFNNNNEPFKLEGN